ncbi:MAG: hypothetical protein M5U34_43845 [Chloroflexi bacterium]|nr:hypothetical protein [Chloroflexota bacterium]
MKSRLSGEGFGVDKAEQYSVIFWIWEILPDQFPFMEKLTPLFVLVERLFVKLFSPLCGALLCCGCEE